MYGMTVHQKGRWHGRSGQPDWAARKRSWRVWQHSDISGPKLADPRPPEWKSVVWKRTSQLCFSMPALPSGGVSASMACLLSTPVSSAITVGASLVRDDHTYDKGTAFLGPIVVRKGYVGGPLLLTMPFNIRKLLQTGYTFKKAGTSRLRWFASQTPRVCAWEHLKSEISIFREIPFYSDTCVQES